MATVVNNTIKAMRPIANDVLGGLSAPMRHAITHCSQITNAGKETRITRGEREQEAPSK